MRRLLLITLVASLLAGCGTPAAVRSDLSRPMTQRSAKVQPTVRVVSAPSVTVSSAAQAPAAKVLSSQKAVEEMLAADASVEAIELLIQDGGAYFVQGWFTDLKDYVKRTWTRWKLSRQVKKELKKQQEQGLALHSKEIDGLKRHRTQPVVKVENLGDDLKEIVTTWTSTYQGTFDIETRRAIDEDGVTQILSVAIAGTNKKGQALEISRVRTLTGEDGTYEVKTERKTTGKDGRTEHQQWLKQVSADGTETITGSIVHPDGHKTEFTGTRDAKGKVKVEVEKITPAK